MSEGFPQRKVCMESTSPLPEALQGGSHNNLGPDPVSVDISKKIPCVPNIKKSGTTLVLVFLSWYY